ncbi:MAG: cell division protein ZapB [Acidobacteria bacterium]|nr:cell division protein ZapB [Acidobacteriota bacterium]
MDLQLEDTDTLTGLEDRILRAVQLVGKLKEENAELKERLAAAESEARLAIAARQEAEESLASYKHNAGKAEQELELLQAERRQVKARIEKLLGQMDILSAS